MAPIGAFMLVSQLPQGTGENVVSCCYSNEPHLIYGGAPLVFDYFDDAFGIGNSTNISSE